MHYSNEFFQYKANLFQHIKSYGFKNEPVRLSSGKDSQIYIDCKASILTHTGHECVSKLFNEIIEKHDKLYSITPGFVAGVALGGCSLVSAVCTNSIGLDGLYIRKEEKTYGSQKLIEGLYATPGNHSTVLLEDVITTGESVINALKLLKEHDYTPIHVIALVDREEGGIENIKKFASDNGWGNDKYSFVTCLYYKSDFTKY